MSEFGFETQGLGGLIIVNDKNFVFEQTTLATVWVVTHNLDKRCAVQIIQEVAEGVLEEVEANIRWVNDNEVEITFNAPSVGYVYCN